MGFCLNTDHAARALRSLQISISVAALAVSLAGIESHAATFDNWSTVVNNAMSLPGNDEARFFSFNQPSVSATGEVVFRARARVPRGGENNEPGGGDDTGEPRGTVQGIFTRDMAAGGGPIETLAQTGLTLVPQPNNLDAVFRAVPSFPRIDVNGNSAFRGQSQPVWQYVVDPSTGEETRIGTTGVFSNAGGSLVTGASQLGVVDGFGHFAVPGTDAIKFDQFPGAPSPTGSIVTFKANWTDAAGNAQTGVYFRDVLANGGESPTGLIAQRGMDIPGEGGVPGSAAKFGSTASPSASGNKVVFTGLDNEDAPTAGGIYIAKIKADPVVQPLVDFSSAVPGEGGETFNRFGEGVSFDGRKVAFWGAWGTGTRTVTLTCPADGNSVSACVAASDKDPVTGEPTGTTTREVPLNQGIFTVDVRTGEIAKIAEVGEDGIAELLFWNFSGNPDANEEEEGPRWRSSNFAALEGRKVVFKATDEDGVDALLLRTARDPNLETVLSTSMMGAFLDPLSPFEAMIVELGIERDGLRGGRLAITASFLNAADESWAGVYLSGGSVAPVPLPAGLPLLVAAFGILGFARLRRSRA